MKNSTEAASNQPPDRRLLPAKRPEKRARRKGLRECRRRRSATASTSRAPTRARSGVSMICGAIRSSSCAHTDAAQETVTTPPRSAVGSAWRAIASPTAAGHTRCTSASSVSGASSSAQRGRAPARSGRGERRRGSRARPPRPEPARRRPPAASRPRSSAPGTWSRSVAVITDWPARRAAGPPARVGARRRARSSRRRAASAAEPARTASASRSASSSASNARRCWPWDP